MAELKTKKTQSSVGEFIDGVADEQQRADARRVLKIMQKATGAKPKMWGPSIVGFGDKHLVYPSGRECDWFLIGFSPRKGTLTLYIMPGFAKYGSLMQKLGPHKTGKCCLYIKRLDDVDMKVLEELVTLSVKHQSGKSKTC